MESERLLQQNDIDPSIVPSKQLYRQYPGTLIILTGDIIGWIALFAIVAVKSAENDWLRLLQLALSVGRVLFFTIVLMKTQSRKRIRYWHESLTAINLISLAVCVGVFLIPQFVLPLMDRLNLSAELLFDNTPTLFNTFCIITELFLSIHLLQCRHKYAVDGTIPAEDVDSAEKLIEATVPSEAAAAVGKKRQVVKWVFFGLIFPDILYVVCGFLGLVGATIAGLFVPLVIGQLVDAFSKVGEEVSVSIQTIVLKLLGVFIFSSLMQLYVYIVFKCYFSNSMYIECADIRLYMSDKM